MVHCSLTAPPGIRTVTFQVPATFTGVAANREEATRRNVGSLMVSLCRWSAFAAITAPVPDVGIVRVRRNQMLFEVGRADRFHQFIAGAGVLYPSLRDHPGLGKGHGIIHGSFVG